jgi:hypothetical protein
MRTRTAGDKSKDSSRIRYFGCEEAVHGAVDERLIRPLDTAPPTGQCELRTGSVELYSGCSPGRLHRFFYPFRVCWSTWKSRLRSVSFVRSAVIVRHACRTVVWSRLPNASPISGRLISVSSLASAIAI